MVLEAWGPDLASCCEEAVAALVAVYAEPSRRAAVGHRDVHLPPAPDEALLLDVLDEVIFTLDTAEGAVPVAARVRSAADGGLDVTLALADRDHVEGTGAVPKAISHSELSVVAAGDGTRCHLLIDV